MLVLSRKAKEELVIPEYGIVLTILEIHGNRVRVGIAAPRHVHVVRREIWQPADDRGTSGRDSNQTSGELALLSEPSATKPTRSNGLRIQ